jgi:hypothetical protein
MVLNPEGKLDKGSGGGDSYLQNVGYYATSCSTLTPPFSEKCRLPVILLELIGPHLSISGGVFADRVNVNPFYSVSLLYHPLDKYRFQEVARCISVLKESLIEMDAYYASQNENLPFQVYQRSQSASLQSESQLSTSKEPSCCAHREVRDFLL